MIPQYKNYMLFIISTFYDLLDEKKFSLKILFWIQILIQFAQDPDPKADLDPAP